MIPQISEINFPAYATLSNATVTLAEMGDRIITTQVKIDGDVVPSFDGWELSFRGERYVLDIKEPQAAKDNTTRNSIIDLTFYSWAVLQLKRYFMFSVATTATGIVMADKYQTPVAMPVTQFCDDLLNNVLDYYFHGKIYVDLNPQGQYSTEPSAVELDYTYIWDVMQDFYKVFGLRWRIEYQEETQSYAIKVGYDAPAIDDHDFEYGYQGGLLRFERQVQNPDIKNILLGRGGERNVPYRYFKAIDPQNPDWAADPDAIPELANVYFDRIRDANFRSYVQGWRAQNYGDTYDASRAATDWAYQKGYTDETFDPVEYVKDDASILKYGEKWGHLEDNDDIYPTIQGIERGGGRIDTVIAVSDITTDDIQGAAGGSAEIIDINGVITQTDFIQLGQRIYRTIQGTDFTVPEGRVMNVVNNGFFCSCDSAKRSEQVQITVDTDHCELMIYDKETGDPVPASGLTEGTYFYKLRIAINNLNANGTDNVTYGVHGLYLESATGDSDAWKPTFDIWVRNIFDSQQQSGESDDEYAMRVWYEILGDHLGSEATIMFSDGFMSISEDYEFKIASYPVVDRSRSLNGFPSEWRITLYKSDAEFDATGLFIPNTTTGGKPVAGDHFYFIGIDMPHLYVTEAERRLNEFKTAALDGTSDISPTWVVQMDKVRADDEYNESQERLFDKFDAGVMLHVRDKRFTNNRILDLYANTVTFTWQDGTVVLPDVEVVLSDEISVTESRVQTIENALNIVQSTMAQMGNVEAVAKVATRPLYLAKTGEDQVSLSPTRFAAIVSSEDFQQGGFGGSGWGMYRDNSFEYQDDNADIPLAASEDADDIEDSDESEETDEQDAVVAPQNSAARTSAQSVFEVDKLIVRHEMLVNNIVVNQIAYVGGKQIISAAAIECVQVVEQPDGYDCYFDQKQGSVKNLFRVNDVAMGQVFNSLNIQLRFYKRLVTKVGIDYIRLSKTVAYGSGIPEKGDVIVQFGNTENEDRQYAIIRDVIGGGYEQMLSNLDSVYNSGVEYYFAGMNANINGDSIPLMTNQGENLRTSRAENLHVRDQARPRFFVGSQESYIEFLEKEKTLYLHGNLVQSPSGIEFPVPCYVGEYSNTQWYYWGDMVTYNGASWIHIGKARTQGTRPTTGDIWRIYADKGSPLYRLDLTNENASINADSSGAILPGAARPTCTATLFYGDDSASGALYAISTPAAQNVAGLSINQTSGVLTFNSGSHATPFNFDGNSLEITITATKDTIVMTAIMTVTKSLPGADGEPATSYWLVLSADKVSVDPNQSPAVAVPATITATAMLQVGEEAPREAVAADGLTIKKKYNTDATYSDYTGAITVDITKKTLYFILYKLNQVVDGAEAVPILYEGKDGEAAIVADLDNEMDAIGVGPNGKLEVPIAKADALITHFSMYFGTAAQELTSLAVDSTTVPTGVSYEVVKVSNVPTGEIKFWVPNASEQAPVTLDGRYPITITGAVGTVNRSLTYTLVGVKTGADGTTYQLVPSHSSIIVDPNLPSGSDRTPTVLTCEKKKVQNGVASDATEAILRVSVDGATPIPYPALGVGTDSVTSNVTFLLYIHDADLNEDVLVDRETVPIVKDGVNGEPGGPGPAGKKMRGISTWNENGYLGNVNEPYQGKNDTTGEFYDIVIDMSDELYYQCLYDVYPDDTTITATSYRPSENNPCWEQMNNYENIATKALAAGQALINQLTSNEAFIRDLKINELTTEGEEIKISNGVITGIKSGDTVFNIHTGGLNSSKSNDTKTRPAQPVSVTTQPGEAQAAVTLLTGIAIGDGYGNNRVAIPAVTIASASASVSPDATTSEWTATRYLTNGTTRLQAGAVQTYSGASLTNQTIPAVTFNNLPAGTWSLLYVVGPDITADNQTLTVSLVMTDNLVISYPQPLGAEIGNDGFRVVYGGASSTQQGIVVTAAGAKVIQDGTTRNILGSSTGKGFEFVAAGESYPSDANMLEGVLYIKLGQST